MRITYTTRKFQYQLLLYNFRGGREIEKMKSYLKLTKTHAKHNTWIVVTRLNAFFDWHSYQWCQFQKSQKSDKYKFQKKIQIDSKGGVGVRC